jgi:hypothetical protein
VPGRDAYQKLLGMKKIEIAASAEQAERRRHQAQRSIALDRPAPRIDHGGVESVPIGRAESR